MRCVSAPGAGGGADEDGDDQQVAQALDGDEQRAGDEQQQRGVDDAGAHAERGGVEAVEADEQQAAVQQRQRGEDATARPPASARSASLTPSTSPNSSSPRPGGGVGGERQQRAEAEQRR